MTLAEAELTSLAQHNDAVIEQAGEDVIAALTARSLFDNIRYKAHSGFLLGAFDKVWVMTKGTDTAA